MHLLINTVSEPATLLIFDQERKILAQDTRETKGKEFDLLLPWIASLLQNLWGLQELQSILVVNGPGSFTGMRIVTLTANSIAFAQNTPLYALDIFELGLLWGWNYPLLLKANREEYLYKKDALSTAILRKKEELEPGEYSGIWTENDFENTRISIHWSIDYAKFLQNYTFGEPTKKVDPLYIKKPNIT